MSRDRFYGLIVAAIFFVTCAVTNRMDTAGKPRFKDCAITRPTLVELHTEGRETRPPELPVEEQIRLGVFTAYAYCPCSACCGQWSGNNLTASGTTPKEGRTIAADWDVLPYGTVIYIDGHQYVVEDTGNGIDGHVLDVFMDSHEGALEFGVQQVEVTIKAPPTGVQDPLAAKKTDIP